jgi:3-hydroxybutyrate dehydrogenase
MLKQKSAIFTGSTSDIGLRIARTVAEEGADVMLNGFSDAHDIEFTRDGLQRRYHDGQRDPHGWRLDAALKPQGE